MNVVFVQMQNELKTNLNFGDQIKFVNIQTPGYRVFSNLIAKYSEFPNILTQVTKLRSTLHQLCSLEY